jgi:DNA-binding beta-propeller fold protein YncE
MTLLRGFSDGQGTAAHFHSPMNLAVNRQGDVYVADFLNHRIRKITSHGEVTTIAGSGAALFADGPAMAAGFYQPYGIAVDSEGNLFVSEPEAHRIRKITPGRGVTENSQAHSSALNVLLLIRAPYEH